jgi:hypothetical protein
VQRRSVQRLPLHTTTAPHADITRIRHATEARVIYLAFAITAIRTGAAKCAGFAGSPYERGLRRFATATIRLRMAVPDVFRCASLMSVAAAFDLDQWRMTHYLFGFQVCIREKL